MNAASMTRIVPRVGRTGGGWEDTRGATPGTEGIVNTTGHGLGRA
jgi:hypothetical protein